MHSTIVVAALSLASLQCVLAQNTSETVLGAVIFNLYGDRTPILTESSQPQTLTPLGAQQMYDTGSLFRSRYIVGNVTPTDGTDNPAPVLNISTYQIDNSQLFAVSTDEEYIVASAAAFLQGLYPPLSNITSSTVLTSEAILANGDVIQYPLGGYQYPQLYTFSYSDPNSVWLAGATNCPQYSTSGDEYYQSSDFESIQSSTYDFYQSLLPNILDGVISAGEADFSNAYGIYDYCNYGYTHNSTVYNNLDASRLEELQYLASQAEYALNGNLSAYNDDDDDPIRTIAGQTLAAKALGQLLGNIASSGDDYKLTIAFVDIEPFISFFALAQLGEISDEFYGLPELGSSMVFELFTVNGNQTVTDYPNSEDLMVRFLFRNGTGNSSELLSYPVFGRGRSATDMTWQDFETYMEEIMIPSIGDWCDACDSQSIFCAGYDPTEYWGNSSNAFGDTGSSSSTTGHSLSPAVGGVIGAVVTLTVVGLVLALAMLLGGLRFHRRERRRTDLGGGFKGSNKLASDPDLTLAGAKTDAKTGETEVKGHERVGSWELGAGGASQMKKDPEMDLVGRGLSDRDDISISAFDKPAEPDFKV